MHAFLRSGLLRHHCPHAARPDALSSQLFAFFPAANEKLGKKEIDRYLLQMRTEEVKRAILVLQQQPTSFASQIINRLSDELTLEVFLDHELMVNITQHELVPQHEVLNDDQKKALLARYKLKETQLPRILKTDAVARYYGLKRGQVVKVIRPSETAGRYVTYRMVM
jgi:DNA-directed RNA polymerase I, II, and III subunit RPABC1